MGTGDTPLLLCFLFLLFLFSAASWRMHTPQRTIDSLIWCFFIRLVLFQSRLGRGREIPSGSGTWDGMGWVGHWLGFSCRAGQDRATKRRRR